jgi:predicted MFS family arabinose efflux permease
MLLGLLALAASTILLNLGTSIAVLIAGRVLQGVSAAVVWVVGLALVADTVPREEVADTLGYILVGLSFGFVVSLLYAFNF